MGKNRPYLILVSLLLLSCICLAQSGRQPAKTNNPKVAEQKTSSPMDEATADVPSTNNAGRTKIPLLVALSQQRRLVMLPPSNLFYAEQIASSLRRQDRLTVEFQPRKVKVEDAPAMLRAKARTYMLLLRFEEFDDRDDSKSCAVTDSKWVTSYKMDYTLLAPEGRILKKRSIQTFFSCARDVKPLFELFVKNCVNRSRNTLDASAVQCMTQQVLNDLYSFER
ncbi:MAG TPA: hypothetical protein VKB46_11595 [Pyrinomonadaceae bacterium]|nr:hypothetical protein [Pyrinomonadaceae bacterium]